MGIRLTKEGRRELSGLEKRREHGSTPFIDGLHVNFIFENLTSMEQQMCAVSGRI